MSRIRLGVNIDHVATVRNARGENYPSPLRAALLAQKNGADSVTVHLREDRRHINESDLKKIKHKYYINVFSWIFNWNFYWFNNILLWIKILFS